jgi:uncharacterized protein
MNQRNTKTVRIFKTILSRTKHFFETTPFYVFVPITYLIYALTLGISLSILDEYTQIPFVDRFDEYGLPDNLFLALLIGVVLGPLIETAFFQTLPFYFLNLFEFFKKHVWLVIVIPAIPFGLLHNYDVTYQIATFIMGVFFMFAYVIRFKKGDSFLCTLLLHSMINAIVILIQHFNL